MYDLHILTAIIRSTVCYFRIIFSDKAWEKICIAIWHMFSQHSDTWHGSVSDFIFYMIADLCHKCFPDCRNLTCSERIFMKNESRKTDT